MSKRFEKMILRYLDVEPNMLTEKEKLEIDFSAVMLDNKFGSRKKTPDPNIMMEWLENANVLEWFH